MKRNPKSPWNPAEIVAVSPNEYEKQVVEWLNSHTTSLKSFKVNHRHNLSGSGGEYELDGYAEIEIFNGATIKVLVECKRHTKPIEREVILAIHAKLQDTGAHKALIFSTSGFQKGAIEYSRSKGIATITFLKGSWLYETRSSDAHVDSPTHISSPQFAGILNYYEGSIHCSTIVEDRKQVLVDFLVGEDT